MKESLDTAGEGFGSCCGQIGATISHLDDQPDERVRTQQGLAASGCRGSLSEPPRAAFATVKPGLEGMIWLQHNHKQGLSLLHLPRILNCSQHLLFDELEAPANITE